MFRSGTTMLARMLDANPSVICASDPYAPIFKSFRNAVGLKTLSTFDPLEPHYDYYFSPRQAALYKRIQQASLDMPLASVELGYLRHQISSQCKQYAPALVPFIGSLSGSNYRELLSEGLKLVEKVYTKCGAQVVGAKEVWVGEFSRHFRSIERGSKVIHIVRDPRSVVASNFASQGRYPLLFLIRQWRKLATLAYLDKLRSPDSTVILFEELIDRPESTARALCEFLAVNFHSDMVDPTCFKDGSGDAWLQNSAFISDNRGSKAQIFNRFALSSWREGLDEKAAAAIEFLCGPEMRLLGYEASRTDVPNDLVFERLNAPEKIAAWIKPYAEYEDARELATEIHRLSLLRQNSELDDNTARLLFIEPEMPSHLAAHVT